MRNLALLATLLCFGCNSSTTGSNVDDAVANADLAVLFVGNSLTYTNDLPDMVRRLLQAHGDVGTVEVGTVAFPNFGLIDHWSQGAARSAIASGQWDCVVIQQGPSATEGRPSLLEYSQRFADDVEAGGGRLALYNATGRDPDGRRHAPAADRIGRRPARRRGHRKREVRPAVGGSSPAPVVWPPDGGRGIFRRTVVSHPRPDATGGFLVIVTVNRSFPRRSSGVRIALVAGLLTAPPATLAAQDPTPAAIDAIFAKYDSTDSPGCALGVYRDGQLVYQNGYGMANLDWGIPIDPSTIFYVGSVSKQFTAASIALLVRAGELSLDDDIRAYLPELPEYVTTVTVGQLVHHIGGMRDMYAAMSASGMDIYDPIENQEAIEVLAAQDLDFTPGERFSYSNGGYFLLAQIGVHLAEHLRAAGNARYTFPQRPWPRREASGHELCGGGFR